MALIGQILGHPAFAIVDNALESDGLYPVDERALITAQIVERLLDSGWLVPMTEKGV